MLKFLIPLFLVISTSFAHAKKYDYTVYIGRFQPVHNGHIKTMHNALDVSNKLIVLCGSSNQSGTAKNPLTFHQRANLILKSLKGYENRVSIAGINDYENDKDWERAVNNTINSLSKSGSKIAIIGHFKDDSSYYLNNFPEYELIKMPNFDNINATDIRNAINNNDLAFVKSVVPSVIYEDIVKLLSSKKIAK